MKTKKPYLHDAIIKLLKEEKHKMTAQEIADALNKNHWYERGDKIPIRANQISARVNKYKRFFKKSYRVNANILEYEVA